jgi:hypothetical protein
MFGCLVAESPNGGTHQLRAFSGMLAGAWQLAGWSPPAFDPRRWRELEARYDPEIAQITTSLANCDNPDDRRDLRARRARCSRALMARYHDLYRLMGASGEERSLEQIVGAGNMASGMGDCCAPKLLNEAHRRGWRPLSLAEFFVGVSRRPGHRVHGRFYAPCREKCEPLMGFLLCPTASSP